MNLLPHLLLLAAAAAAAAAATSLKPITKRGAAPADFAAKDAVVLSYGQDARLGADDDVRYHADLTVHSHAGRKILALPAIAAATSAITCDARGVRVVFIRASDAVVAAALWAEREIVVVAECGREQAVFSVEKVRVDPPAVRLFATPITWAMAARRMSVSLDHSRPERLEHELVRRDDEDGENAEATLSLTTPLPERILLYPLPVGSRNKTGGGGGDKNTAGQSQSATKTDIQVSCVDCSTSGSLLVKAAFDFDLLGTDNNTVGSLEVGKLDAASLYIELAEDFNATANLEIFAGASTSLSFQQSIFPLGPIALSPFNLGGVLSVGPLFDFEVVLDIAGPSGSVNMSYGTELVVPKGSKANLTYGANNQSFASGWDEARIHEIPFNVTALDGELSFGVNLTARPRFTFGIQMLGGAVATLDAGFEADLPKVYAKATAVTNVTSTCAPAGAGNGTYYPAAIKLETGLGLELRAVAGFEAGGQGILPALIDQTFSYPLLSKDFPGAELCYGFDEKALGTMFPITDKKPLSPNATAPAEGAHAVDSGAVKVEMGPLGMLMAVGAGVFLL